MGPAAHRAGNDGVRGLWLSRPRARASAGTISERTRDDSLHIRTDVRVEIAIFGYDRELLGPAILQLFDILQIIVRQLHVGSESLEGFRQSEVSS